MLSRSKARMQEAENLIPFHCFKCKFFTTSKNFINKHMTLQHMMGRAEIDLPDLFIKCFKCSFSSREGVDVDKHMTISHLMGEKTKAEIDKYVTLSTPNLLFSTLHVGHEDRFSVDSDKSDLCSMTSKISGVDLFSESGSEAEHNAMENFVDNPDKVSTPALLDSPSTPRSNLRSEVLNRGMID